jgi:hypothetical protein
MRCGASNKCTLPLGDMCRGTVNIRSRMALGAQAHQDVELSCCASIFFSSASTRFSKSSTSINLATVLSADTSCVADPIETSPEAARATIDLAWLDRSSPLILRREAKSLWTSRVGFEGFGLQAKPRPAGCGQILPAPSVRTTRLHHRSGIHRLWNLRC